MGSIGFGRRRSHPHTPAHSSSAPAARQRITDAARDLLYALALSGQKGIGKE